MQSSSSSPQCTHVESPRFALGVSMLLLLGLWLLARPYAGVRHDGILYLGQVLHHWHPAIVANDVFFSHGSQDSFSVFSRLLVPLYERWGAAWVPMLVVALSSLASFAAVWQLLRELPDGFARVMGLGCTALLSPIYGGLGVSLSENFLTARTLAEPLALWALVMVGRDTRAAWITGGTLLVAAALVHPLMTFPLLLIVWLMLCQQNHRWHWLAAVSVLPVFLALAGIPPFDGLLRRYDPTWWHLIDAVNNRVMMSQWTGTAWLSATVDLITLAAMARLAPKHLAGLSRATLFAVMMLCAASLLGGDLAHNQLVTALQLSRALWVAHALALLSTPWVLMTLWHTIGSNCPVAAMATLACTSAVLAADVGWTAGWVMLGWAGLAVWAVVQRQLPVSRGLAITAAAMSLICMAAMAALQAQTRWAELAVASGEPVLTQAWRLMLTTPLLTLTLLAAVYRLAAVRVAQLVLAVSAGGLAVLGVSNWDARAPWTRFVETGLTRTHPFEAFMEPQASVYWHEQLAAVWMLMHRPSHFVKAQGAGLLFNAQTAEDFGARWEAYKPLRELIQGCELQAWTSATATRSVRQQAWTTCVTPTVETVQSLCRGAARPDYMVFERMLSVPPLASWQWKEPPTSVRDFYLYGCKQFL